MTELEKEMLAALNAVAALNSWDLGLLPDPKLPKKGGEAWAKVRAAIANAEPKPHVYSYPPGHEGESYFGCHQCGNVEPHPIHIQPKPRRFLVEQFGSATDVSGEFLPDATLVSYRGMRVIREVKPITLEQIDMAMSRSEHMEWPLPEHAFIHRSRMGLFLRQLGIEVEE